MKAKYVVRRLALSFGCLIAILVGVGYLGLNYASKLSAGMDDIVTHQWNKVQLSFEALRYSTRNNRITMQVFLESEDNRIPTLLAERASNTEKISQLMNRIGPGIKSPEEQALFDAIWTKRIPYVNSYKEALALLLDQKNPEEGREVMINTTLPRLLEYHSAWEAFVQFQGDQLDAARRVAGTQLLSARRIILTLMGAGTILGIVIAIFATGNLTKEIATRQEAEVLRLARTELERRVAERTAELEKTHQELLKASRQAGMAEMAAGVLHNVGNVLNSVNVSATLIGEQMQKSKSCSLSKVTALLSEHSGDLGRFITNDPKGKLVPAFLEQLAEQLAKERATILGELQRFAKSVEHIREIVRIQQTCAKTQGVIEEVKPSELVEEAIRMSLGSPQQHGLKVTVDCGHVSNVTLEKHKALQILVNLISNAKHACKASQQPEKKIGISVTEHDGCLRIVVTDNGVGIPPNNLEHIFEHGFTTRKEGHGFGLHSSAAAAKDIRGRLLAQSDGPGLGASFILELPVHSSTARQVDPESQAA